MDHFHLNKLVQAQADNNIALSKYEKGLPQYSLLSSNGKEIYNTEYELKVS
jgi:hypothetical protein